MDGPVSMTGGERRCTAAREKEDMKWMVSTCWLYQPKIPFSQLMPLNPSGQLQLYDDSRLEQVPPFMQGVSAQKFIGGTACRQRAHPINVY